MLLNEIISYLEMDVIYSIHFIDYQYIAHIAISDTMLKS